MANKLDEQLLLPEYGFGSWLKDNSAGLLQGASALAPLLPPPIGTIAGPVLQIAGSVVGGIQAGNQAQEAADEQAKIAGQADLANRNASFMNKNRQVSYGSSIAEFGGDMNGMLDTPMNQPMITEYSDKAFKHGQGPNGVPVDSKGNPATTSKQSAIGLTEGGEVTWNGYVFSNKLELD